MQQNIQIQYLKKQVSTLTSNLDELMERESLNMKRETMQAERMQEIDLRIQQQKLIIKGLRNLVKSKRDNKVQGKIKSNQKS